MTDVPDDHPRATSLRTRERIAAGVDAGITHRQGLIAHGRGEAFDYLLGERTIESADEATRAAAGHLRLARHPVLSVNGNVAALVPGEVVALAETVGADIEVNLFHRDAERIEAIADHLREHGARDVKGLTGDASIPGLDHDRARVDADGLYDADVVVVPLEDGDRAAALAEMGKVGIVIDLNPRSRSARAATVPIVDNVTRAVPNLARHASDLRVSDPADLRAMVEAFDAESALADAERAIRSGSLEDA